MKTKKRNKLALLIIPVAAAAAMFSACGGEKINQGPELRGVGDYSCLAGTRVDLLGGVAALDEEDGDITPQMQITVNPQVEIKDGYAKFDETGDYEVCYEVRDSGGKLARATANISAVEREEFGSAMFSNGFSASAGGSARILSEGVNGNEFSFKAAGGTIAEDIKLSRKFDMEYDNEYTFEYIFSSSKKGKIYLAADGKKIGERLIAAGENRISFNHIVESEQNAQDTASVNMELWLGYLEGEIEIALKRVELEFIKEDEGLIELLQDFDFNGKTHDRFDNDGGNIVLNASTEVTNGGKGVKLKVTETNSQDRWRGGVFVNTGLPLSEGEYFVSFELSSDNDNPYDVQLLRKQWGPDEGLNTVEGSDGQKEITLSIDAAHTGNLWLYIQSGDNVNNIELKNLSVKTQSGGLKRESYAIGGFTCGGGELKSEYGKAEYTVESFGGDWGNNELGSPEFEILSGSAENLAIQFRAKVSKSVKAVFAATLASNWNTFVWQEIYLSEGEQIYSVQCNDKKELDGIYKLVWQFGNSDNNGNGKVTIEICDIKICYKNKAIGDKVDE